MADAIFKELIAGTSFKKTKYSHSLHFQKSIPSAASNKNAANLNREISAINIGTTPDASSAENLNEGTAHALAPKKRLSGQNLGKDAASFVSDYQSARSIRRRYKIYIYPRSNEKNVPVPVLTFESLLDMYKRDRKENSDNSTDGFVVSRWMIENMKRFNIQTPTPIQMQVIPMMLKGHNIVGCAPTGSGKTMSFLLPLLAKLKTPGKEFARALVICPSRELAIQIFRVFQRFKGGKKFKAKVLDKFSKNTEDYKTRLDLAISTPLRLLTLCRNELVQLSDCRYLVLDEADKLLDMGFTPQIDELLTYTKHPSLELFLFCATMSDTVLQLADTIMHNPIRVAVGTPNAAAESIEQSLVFVTTETGKLDAFRQLVTDGKIIPPTLVFVDRKERATQLFNELIYDGIFVDVIHANRTKSQRDAVVESFRTGKTWVLICTDLMGRGLDIKGVSVVINFDFPNSTPDYIHRIGRTGRAGCKGKAITFYTLSDIPLLPIVVNVMRQSGCEIPHWLSNISKLKKGDRQSLKLGKRKRSKIS